MLVPQFATNLPPAFFYTSAEDDPVVWDVISDVEYQDSAGDNWSQVCQTELFIKEITHFQ